MRLRTWLTVATLCTTALGLADRAVGDEPFGAPGPYGPPPMGGYAPGGYAPNGFDPSGYGQPPFVDPGGHYCPPGAHGHGHNGLDALQGASVPMVPPNFAPYPAISPYENNGEQHRHWNGLWFKDIFGPRQTYTKLSAMLMTGRQPHKSPITLVGYADGGVTAGTDLTGGYTAISTLAFEDDPEPLAFRGSGNQGRSLNRAVPSVRAAIGWIQPAGDAIEVNAWLVPGGTAFYQRGLGFGSGAILHGLPLDTGAATYDQLFRIQFQSNYFGAGGNFLTNDMWPSEHKSFRVLYGVRMLYVSEEFGFYGQDSGGGLFDPYVATLNSKVQSTMIGPQIGIDYSFGGDTYKLNGQTKVGVMANFTEYDLNGMGMGSPFLNTAYDPFSEYSDTEDHAHLSPLLEQSLDFEMDLIPILPILKHSSLLRNSKIHVGYWVVFVKEVARPQNVIDWRDQPLNPRLESNLASLRSQWYTHGWKFGFTSTW